MITRLLPFVALAIAVGIFFTYINPTYTTIIASLSSEIKSYDSALAAATQFSTKEEELATERNKIPADGLQRIETYLPDGVDNVQLILDLNALAARSGLTLSNFDIQDNATAVAGSNAPTQGTLSLGSENPTDSLDLSVNATGTYSAFRTFLAGVEQSLRPLDLTTLQIKDSTTGVYTYQMTFRIYWLR